MNTAPVYCNNQTWYLVLQQGWAFSTKSAHLLCIETPIELVPIVLQATCRQDKDSEAPPPKSRCH